jgi:hypothetical protein
MKRYTNFHGSMTQTPNGPWVDVADVRELQDRLAALEKLVDQLEHPTDPEDEGMLPKYARYLIEWFRKEYPKC